MLILYANGQRYRNRPFDAGLGPFIGQEVHAARHARDRKVQRALLQFVKPENDFEVRDELSEAGRQYLIDLGYDARIPAQLPREIVEAGQPGDPRDTGRPEVGTPPSRGGK
jgi:hypothetical protein